MVTFLLMRIFLCGTSGEMCLVRSCKSFIKITTAEPRRLQIGESPETWGVQNGTTPGLADGVFRWLHETL